MLGAAILLVDRPFKKGDLIEACGHVGTVEEVGLRSTNLRTLDDALVVVPNARLADDIVNNWGRLRTRRIMLTVPLALQTPRETLDRFVARLRTTFAAQPAASERPAYIGLRGVGEGTLDVGLMGWLTTPNYGDFVAAQDRLVSDIVGLAEEMGVQIVPPAEATEGDDTTGGPEALLTLRAVPEAKSGR